MSQSNQKVWVAFSQQSWTAGQAKQPMTQLIDKAHKN
jgi:hypothetical protein